jgi:hypothetical protein
VPGTVVPHLAEHLQDLTPDATPTKGRFASHRIKLAITSGNSILAAPRPYLPRLTGRQPGLPRKTGGLFFCARLAASRKSQAPHTKPRERGPRHSVSAWPKVIGQMAQLAARNVA